jgi:hypothetical protein
MINIKIRTVVGTVHKFGYSVVSEMLVVGFYVSKRIELYLWIIFVNLPAWFLCMQQHPV